MSFAAGLILPCYTSIHNHGTRIADVCKVEM
jgi:hypothetical protein